jgi:LytS/YehU family sensor histidine kinase
MKRVELFLDYLFSRQRWVIHVFFWLLILVFYVIFFGRRNSNYLQTFFFVGLLMPVTIGTTYLLNYYLVPRYLMKERYGFFLLYFIYTLIGSIFLEMMIAMLTFIVMAEVNIKEMSPASIDIFFLLTSLLMVIFLGVAIKFLNHWRTSREDYQKLMRERVEAELRFLKVQLNPHFLFNTLNNLYYLTSEKSEKAPQAILQLSEMLDYVMHSSKSMFVPLEKELKQVENYIALESLRYEERVKITTKFSDNLNERMIGPMILITLIENAFKHGVMPVARNAWINLVVEDSERGLSIVISNSAMDANPGEGIGLENLKSQLNHLYKDNYTMKTERSKVNEFSVTLILNQSK